MSSTASRKEASSFASVSETLRAIVGPQRLPAIERTLARQMIAALEQYRHELAAVAEPLTDAERAALASVGVEPGVAPAMLPGGVVSYAVMAGTALPLAEAASMLDVTTGRLRQRLAEGDLLGIRGEDGRSWRIPAFQFADGRELPGLRGVLKAIPDGVHPLEIAAFFATPQPDLEAADGSALTPTAWLRSGGDPGPVADLARDL